MPRYTSRPRLQICADGVRCTPPGERARYLASPRIVTSAGSQAGLLALLQMEDDPHVRSHFQKGLRENASGAAPYMSWYRSYDNDNTLAFNINWRTMLSEWKPQASIADAVKLQTLKAASKPGHLPATEPKTT
ncbi:MAG: hypothetical protein N3B01_00590 [Verrucomicrobiae bacterium]|nr:hypothetical protein [Verrucomicrobiae bacterium]